LQGGQWRPGGAGGEEVLGAEREGLQGDLLDRLLETTGRERYNNSMHAAFSDIKTLHTTA
jgi:hypothetical protein